jgi:hypothetical protein
MPHRANSTDLDDFETIFKLDVYRHGVRVNIFNKPRFSIECALVTTRVVGYIARLIIWIIHVEIVSLQKRVSLSR